MRCTQMVLVSCLECMRMCEVTKAVILEQCHGFLDLRRPLALEVLNQQQQAARLSQWNEAAGPFLPGGVAFPLPQQIPHLAQPGIARFSHQLHRAANWGLGANMEDEAGSAASTGPPFNRLDHSYQT